MQGRRRIQDKVVALSFLQSCGGTTHTHNNARQAAADQATCVTSASVNRHKSVVSPHESGTPRQSPAPGACHPPFPPSSPKPLTEIPLCIDTTG